MGNEIKRNVRVNLKIAAHFLARSMWGEEQEALAKQILEKQGIDPGSFSFAHCMRIISEREIQTLINEIIAAQKLKIHAPTDSMTDFWVYEIELRRALGEALYG